MAKEFAPDRVLGLCCEFTSRQRFRTEHNSRREALDRTDERPERSARLRARDSGAFLSGLERHHTSPALIPQHEAPLPKPAPKRHDRRRLQHEVRVMTLLQPIVGDPGIQMVNVVKANIAGEPLQ